MIEKPFSDLLGQTITKIDHTHELQTDELWFHRASGETYKMYHEGECCEGVTVEDITGDLKNLLCPPITIAEKATSEDKDGFGDHITWNFYKLATACGYITIRWFGSSNGFYSGEVDFVLVNKEEK